LLATVCCDLFKEKFRGEWKWAVRRDYYAVLFRPGWLRAFGKWNSSQLMRFENNDSPPVVAAVHFRLPIEVPPDEEQKKKPAGALRLKCTQDTASERQWKALQRELADLFKGKRELIAKPQFTLPIGRRPVKTPPGVSDKDLMDEAARAVLARHFSNVALHGVIRAIDRAAKVR
jgi:hypothetical protein